MTKQEERTILRLWKDWCKLWPEQYGHESLHVRAEGYDPVFDVVPSQTYKDFYLEVIRDHPTLKHINVFEVVDTALNQTRAPENAPVSPVTGRVASVELDLGNASPSSTPLPDSQRDAEYA